MICEECNDTGIVGADETSRYCTCDRGEFHEYADVFGYKLTEDNFQIYANGRATQREMTEDERAKWRDDNGPG
jgi:hypothetical protein